MTTAIESELVTTRQYAELFRNLGRIEQEARLARENLERRFDFLEQAQVPENKIVAANASMVQALAQAAGGTDGALARIGAPDAGKLLTVSERAQGIADQMGGMSLQAMIRCLQHCQVVQGLIIDPPKPGAKPGEPVQINFRLP